MPWIPNTQISAAGGGSGVLTGICDSLLGSDGTFDTNTILGGNIPSSYKSLRLEMQIRSDIAATNDDVLMRFNNDSGANYDTVWIYGTTAAGPGRFAEAGATRFDFSGIPGDSATAGNAAGIIAEIPNYANTTFWKNVEARCSGSTGSFSLISTAGIWHSTAALIRISIFPLSGTNFKTGSRFTLYGMG